MVAWDNTWGNEGSLYVISNTLNVTVIAICVDKDTHTKSHINKIISPVTQSVIPQTIINEINYHFVTAHRKSSSPEFNIDV